MDASTLPVLNVLIQGGSFSLLAYIIIWGFPKWQQEIREDRVKVVDRYFAMIAEMNASFDERTKAVLSAIEKSHREIIERLDRRESGAKP